MNIGVGHLHSLTIFRSEVGFGVESEAGKGCGRGPMGSVHVESGGVEQPP